MSTAQKHQEIMTEIIARIGGYLRVDDNKRLSLALVRVAAEEAERNNSFAERVRAAYTALPQPRARPKMVTAFDVKLVPIKRVEGREINPAEALDPYFLHEVYGSAQLPAALSIFPVSKLKEGAEMVQRRNPGTRPANRGQRQALTDYIVTHVVGHK